MPHISMKILKTFTIHFLLEGTFSIWLFLFIYLLQSRKTGLHVGMQRIAPKGSFAVTLLLPRAGNATPQINRRIRRKASPAEHRQG